MIEEVVTETKNFFKNIYEYNYHAIQWKKTLRWGLFVLVILMLITLGYYVGSKLEASAVKSEMANLQNQTFSQRVEIRDLNSALGAAVTDLDSTSEALDEKSSLLSEKDSELLGLREDLDLYIDKDNENADKIIELEAQVDAFSEWKVKALENSASNVQAICCSFNDIIDGRSLKWGFDDSKVVCGSGIYSVSCSSGDTDFDGE
jgi:hypothetical protein